VVIRSRIPQQYDMLRSLALLGHADEDFGESKRMRRTQHKYARRHLAHDVIVTASMTAIQYPRQSHGRLQVLFVLLDSWAEYQKLICPCLWQTFLARREHESLVRRKFRQVQRPPLHHIAEKPVALECQKSSMKSNWALHQRDIRSRSPMSSTMKMRMPSSSNQLGGTVVDVREVPLRSAE